MRSTIKQFITLPLIIIALSFSMINKANADEWTIQKMSGDVWIETTDLKKIALTKNSILKNGHKIKTGQNGRVLLKRNKETILISPNSIIGLPKQPEKTGKTLILHQSGEILLDVEKKNVKHFEVSTPYLAAVVKGTHFSVTVNEEGSKVDVLRGKVEVSDFKTGKFVLVKPGQSALVHALSKNNKFNKGIILQGDGPKEKIQQGKTKSPKVKPIKSLTRKNNSLEKAKQTEKNTKKLKAGLKKRTIKRAAKKKVNNKKTRQARKTIRKKRKMRIGRAIGHVKLNAHKSTRGLVKRVRYASRSSKKRRANKNTYWAISNGKSAKSISSSITKNNKAAKKGNKSNNTGNRNGNQNSSSNNNSSNSITNSSKNGVSQVLGNGNGNGNGNAYAYGQNNGNGNAYGNWWKNIIAAWKKSKNK